MMEYGPGYLELRLGMVGQKGEEEKMEETRDKDAQWLGHIGPSCC